MVRSLLMRISNLSMMGLVSCDPFIPYKFPSMHSFCKRFFINWFCSELEYCESERPVLSMLVTFLKFLSLLNRTAFNGQCWARHQWITILHYNRNNQLVFIIFYLSSDQVYIFIALCMTFCLSFFLVKDVEMRNISFLISCDQSNINKSSRMLFVSIILLFAHELSTVPYCG